jgi:hypothetical protein
LAEAGKDAPVTAEILADFLRDLDDPRRVVEINDAAAATTGRTGEQPGTRNTMGYTGFEGLLNYAYYQSLALNQFDRAGHTLHIGLQEVFTGPCGAFSTGRNPTTGDYGIPTDGGGTTTSFDEAPRCGTWLGPNQPGVNEDLGLPKYHPSVCPQGTAPDRARIELCDMADPARARRNARAGRSGPGGDGAGSSPGDGPAGPIAPGGGKGPLDPDEIRDELEDILDMPGGALDDLGLGGKGKKGGLGSLGKGSQQATEDILDILFGP